jgi:SAM-dependent methyltransferase
MSELVLREARLSQPGTLAADAPFALAVEFAVEADVLFDVDVSLDLTRADGQPVAQRQLRAAGWDPTWLPRGGYRAHALAPRAGLPEGDYRIHVALWHHRGAHAVKAAESVLPLRVEGGDGAGPALAWQLESLPGTTPIGALSWRKGHADWFFKHFDHAARVVASYMLGDSPLLSGRILDVGCGDGVTDLGIALRQRPQELVGIDPFRGYERLPQILRDAGMPLRQLPDNLRFLPASANEIPFPDDTFDVVLSWGSLEHIAGGHAQALREIRRVLRRDGLLFAHPGLYYSDVGHHLGEFAFARAEPYVHLKMPREALRERVLAAQPDYIDRAGEFATPAQYWQWFTELNPITTDSFERELRALGFEPWRVALRAHDRVDYSPELQPYGFMQLGIAELYVSAWNRKA